MAKSTLDPRDKLIMMRLREKQVTDTAIAYAFGLTRERIGQLLGRSGQSAGRKCKELSQENEKKLVEELKGGALKTQSLLSLSQKYEISPQCLKKIILEYFSRKDLITFQRDRVYNKVRVLLEGWVKKHGKKMRLTHLNVARTLSPSLASRAERVMSFVDWRKEFGLE